MVNKCGVVNCKGNYNAINKCRVFKIPKNEEERKKWLAVLPPRDNFSLDPEKFFVCEKHWPADHETVLSSTRSKVVSCRPAQVTVLQSGKKSKVQCHEVILEDTVLFPEGGGQPDDRGMIGDAEVIKVERRGATAVHYTMKELSPGSEVSMTVDWDRRFDHMQQHSAQHLITAVADSLFGYKTTSWSLGEGIVTIELDTPALTPEQLEKIESQVNDKIRQQVPVTPRLYPDKHDPQLQQFRVRGLPDDHEGPVRVLDIEGVDATLCCGTHVDNLSHLQGPLDKHVELADKAVKGFKSYQKISQSLMKDVALLEAQLYNSRPDKEAVFCHFRKDAESDYMNVLVNQILSDNPETVVMVCVGDDKGSGLFTLAGPQEVVSAMGPKLAEVLEAKGAVTGGRYRGKVNKMPGRAKAEKLLQEHVASLPQAAATGDAQPES